MKKSSYIVLKRILIMMVTACMVLLSSCGGSSGTCGKDLKWVLNDGKLSITGSGAMEDFPEELTAPWAEEFKSYASVHVSEIYLSEGLTHIGDWAFTRCEIKEISIPGSVTSIGKGAFIACGSLEKITLPEGLEKIEYAVFMRDAALMEVYIPESVKVIDWNAFAYCNDQLRVIYGGSAQQWQDVEIDPEGNEILASAQILYEK